MSANDRRRFLQYLAASPCIAALGGLSPREALAQTAATTGVEAIADPAQALSVMDFEGLARSRITPGHWAYLSSGVDDDLTLRANRDAFARVQLRPRRLRDATRVDTRTRVLGVDCSLPVFTCPIGGNRAYHADGELAVARAVRARGTMQCLSTMASFGTEDVTRALGQPVWQQLYAPTPWDACAQMVRRIAAAGCQVLVLTVDVGAGRNTETFLRTRGDTRLCTGCHDGPGGPPIAQKPMFTGIDTSKIRVPYPAMDWEFVSRLRELWKGKLLLKGLESGEDARLAVERGIDGVVVSNHGGRATETLRATLDSLPDIVAAVAGRATVLVDGGFRRGTDVFKALALGADAVGIGRPFVWGLGAFGQAGVERVLEILQAELRLVMGACGTPTVRDITRGYIATAAARTP